MRTVGLIILGAPLSYFLLTAYLLNKVRPLPIVLLPLGNAEDEGGLQTLAA